MHSHTKKLMFFSKSEGTVYSTLTLSFLHHAFLCTLHIPSNTSAGIFYSQDPEFFLKKGEGKEAKQDIQKQFLSSGT